MKDLPVDVKIVCYCYIETLFQADLQLYKWKLWSSFLTDKFCPYSIVMHYGGFLPGGFGTGGFVRGSMSGRFLSGGLCPRICMYRDFLNFEKP